MKLYRVDTYGLKEFCVVAPDPTAAETRVKELLDLADYGYRKDRLVTSITLLSEEVSLFVPNISDTHRLILPASCADIKKEQ